MTGAENLKEMWDTLELRLSGTATRFGRLNILIEFGNEKLKRGESVEILYQRMLQHKQKLYGTSDAISGSKFKTQLYSVLPDQFSSTIEIPYDKLDDYPISDVLEKLKQAEAQTKNKTIMVADDNSTNSLALYARSNYSIRGRGRGGFR